jgi:3-dehydroquinate synthase
VSPRRTGRAGRYRIQSNPMKIASLTLNNQRSTISMTPPAEALRLDGLLPDIVVVDGNTESLLPADYGGPCVCVPAGEQCKQFSVLHHLLEEFVRFDLRRDSLVGVLGGGAVTDLAAFAANIYLRGLPVLLVPTTLLAMVDAAIGGKTGLDFAGFKNLVGTFYPAREVHLVPQLLSSLPDSEYRSGLAEVIKVALLDDPELLLLLEGRSGEVLAREESVVASVITRAVQVKCRVVGEDYTEQGRRAHLNLGHTFGHALEAVLGFGTWTHGDAVAWGIARAMDAGLAIGITERAWAERVYGLLERYGYPVHEKPATGDVLIAAMRKDKKRRRAGIGFILQTGPFQTVQRTLEDTILESVLRNG